MFQNIGLVSRQLSKRSCSLGRGGLNQARFSSDSFKLKIGRLNHVAIAVPSLSESSSTYRDVLGAKVSDPVDIPEHGVTTVFVELANTKIELISPFGEKSPIGGFLSKNKKGGVHHVCFEVDDLNSAASEIEKEGKLSILAPAKIGAHGKPVIFLHPKDMNGVLVELEQK